MKKSSFTFLQKLRNKIKIKGSNNNILIDKRIKFINNKVIIKGSNNTLEIDKNTNIRGTFIQIIGDNCKIIINENTIIGTGCYLSSKEHSINLHIGKDCMLSRNAKIMTSDGHPIYNNNKKRINIAKSITIGSKVWIADNATILKGANIGDNCVVGINSILTKSIPSNTIATGNPAKIIKENITWGH